LVFIFVEPLLRLAANGLMWLGANISGGFTKAVYTSAAMGLREKFSFMHLLFTSALFLGAIAGVGASVVRHGMKRATENPAQTPRFRKLKSTAGLLYVLTTIASVTYVSAQNFIELQLNASFNQRLTVLAAKVSDQRIKEIRATWALMESRHDYEAINSEMARLSKEQGVRLPDALWD
jgi:hypothetical protein